MFGLMKVFGGVSVLGRIAAAHVPAYHAEAQMNPLIARLQALFTTVCVWPDILDLIQMRAFFHVRWYCILAPAGENAARTMFG
jgi:hypothetical protein